MNFPDVLTEEDMQLMRKELLLISREPELFDWASMDGEGVVEGFREWGQFGEQFTYILHRNSGLWVKIPMTDATGCGIPPDKADKLAQAKDLDGFPKDT